MASPTLVSGIRSTGELHLGNYYGALKGLLDAQEQYKAYYFIADLHALTTQPKSEDRIKNVIEIAKDYIAAGLDPQKCVFYAQSTLAPELAELQLYLSMIMPLGELLRCPTFKEKAKKHPDNVNYGLVGYPVLMTADILIHKGSLVQVGEDQLAHLEMARTMQRRFNQLYGPIFPEPQPMLEHAVRIPSLSGQGKMSKSDTPSTYISMKDEKELVDGKIKKAYSDPTRAYRHQPGTPTLDGCNVYHLHTFFSTEETTKTIALQCRSAEIGCVQCKAGLAESINTLVQPFRARRAQLSESYIHDVLLEGHQQAKQSAQEVISEVREAMNLRML